MLLVPQGFLRSELSSTVLEDIIGLFPSGDAGIDGIEVVEGKTVVF